MPRKLTPDEIRSIADKASAEAAAGIVDTLGVVMSASLVLRMKEIIEQGIETRLMDIDQAYLFDGR